MGPLQLLAEGALGLRVRAGFRQGVFQSSGNEDVALWNHEQEERFVLPGAMGAGTLAYLAAPRGRRAGRLWGGSHAGS